MKKIFTILSVAMLAVSANAQTLNVYEGTDLSGQIPVNGLYTDTEGTTSQMIYPADMLTDMTGMMITGIKFFPESTVKVAGCTLQLSLKEVEQNAFDNAGPALITDATPVATIALEDASATELLFMLDTPFEYTGGNLLVETLVTSSTENYSSTSFLGTNTDFYGSMNYYNWWWESNTAYQFMPKTEFAYEEADLTAIGDVNADKAVANVRYYNMAGQQVSNPSGVTIEVTTYTDGTSSSTKVVK